MNKIFKLASAALVAAFMTSNSIADQEGISIGVWGSSLDLDSYGTEQQDHSAGNTIDTEKDIVSATKSSSHDVGSFFIEYTAEQGSSIGFEFYPGTAQLGSGSRTDTCTCGEDAGTTTQTYTAKADVKNVATVYIEPTYMLNDFFGVYGKAGITTMHVTSIESLKSGGSVYPNTDTMGAMYGLGLKARHPSGLFLKLEGSVTDFRPIELTSTTGNAGTINAEIDIEAVRLGVGYTF